MIPLLLLAAAAGSVVVGAPGARAQDRPSPTPAPVDVIEVRGRIDAIEAAYIERSIRASEDSGSQLLVLQLDSPGALVSDARLDDLAAAISGAGLPVTVWVGPSGAEARGGAVRLVEAAVISGSATRARIRGDGRTLDPQEARAAGVVDVVSPTLGDFIVELDGREVDGKVLRTARVVQRDTPRREPIAEVRFAKLGLAERVLHATTAPWAAYVLFLIGLLLIVFELYAVGIGLAGLTGAISLALGAYGLAALGAAWLGIGLLLVAAFGYAVDVQAGAPRAWSVIASLSLIAGGWVLYPGDLRLALWVQALSVIGVLVFMLRAMPSVVRARFSTPTIGREAMVGETARAASAFDPEGTVQLRGGMWRARATRASKIATGDPVRVVSLDGLVLEVEPLSDDAPGAAPAEDAAGGGAPGTDPDSAAG